MNDLNALSFQCEQQDDCTYTYEHAVKHANTCAVKAVKCLLDGCDKEFRAVEDFINHLNEQCLKVKLQCEVCEIERSRSDNLKHDCRDGLKVLVKRLRTEAEC